MVTDNVYPTSCPSSFSLSLPRRPWASFSNTVARPIIGPRQVGQFRHQIKKQFQDFVLKIDPGWKNYLGTTNTTEGVPLGTLEYSENNPSLRAGPKGLCAVSTGLLLTDRTPQWGWVRLFSEKWPKLETKKISGRVQCLCGAHVHDLRWSFEKKGVAFKKWIFGQKSGFLKGAPFTVDHVPDFCVKSCENIN